MSTGTVPGGGGGVPPPGNQQAALELNKTMFEAFIGLGKAGLSALEGDQDAMLEASQFRKILAQIQGLAANATAEARASAGQGTAPGRQDGAPQPASRIVDRNTLR